MNILCCAHMCCAAHICVVSTCMYCAIIIEHLHIYASVYACFYSVAPLLMSTRLRLHTRLYCLHNYNTPLLSTYITTLMPLLQSRALNPRPCSRATGRRRVPSKSSRRWAERSRVSGRFNAIYLGTPTYTSIFQWRIFIALGRFKFVCAFLAASVVNVLF